MEEQWKFILGSEDLYQVSNLGRVRRVNGRVLKNTLMKIGYYSVALSIRGKAKRRYVHELVANQFVGGNFSGAVINHKDGDKLNNNCSNLEYVSRKANATHWAKENRVSTAGRKRSGFCGRGHKLSVGQTQCNECRRLNSSKIFTPPENLNWVLVNGFDYQISDCGLIWSNKTNRILKLGIDSQGYAFVILRKNNKSHRKSVSRLVAAAFIGEIDEGLVVDHLNSDKLDNRAENLRIVSHSENIKFAHDEKRKKGTHGYKYDEKLISEVKWLMQNTELKINDIKRFFGVSQSLLSSIKDESKWQHVKPKKLKKIPTGLDDIMQKRRSYREAIMEIKWLTKNSQMPNKEIAERYKVNSDIVSNIRVGRNWAELENKKPPWFET